MAEFEKLRVAADSVSVASWRILARPLIIAAC
jgi:hypothetical protein